MQGHVAYPHKCDNAAHHAAALMLALSQKIWDEGSEFFPKSSFEITNISYGTGAENVVPGSCYFMCNWRYNNNLDKDRIEAMVNEIVDKLKVKCSIEYVVNGVPFVTKGGLLLDTLKESIKEVTKVKPQFSTASGTSDSRFIAPLGTKVVEFGPISSLIHKVDEAVELDSLDLLTDIYIKTLNKIYSKA